LLVGRGWFALRHGNLQTRVVFAASAFCSFFAASDSALAYQANASAYKGAGSSAGHPLRCYYAYQFCVAGGHPPLLCRSLYDSSLKEGMWNSEAAQAKAKRFGKTCCTGSKCDPEPPPL
jgi:hypothetical protein